MDRVSQMMGSISGTAVVEECNAELTASLPAQATGEPPAFAPVNGPQANDSHWPRKSSPPELGDSGRPSPVCFGSLGMETLSDQLLIWQGGLDNNAYPVDPPDLGEVGIPYPDMSMAPPEEDSEAFAAGVQQRGATRGADSSQDKGKHRQGRLADRSGSPFSSSDSTSSMSDHFTTVKDTYSFETNETSSSSAEVGSDRDKTSSWSMANFDRVLHDAPKREHIRSRKCGKGSGDQSDSCAGSQSRSKPTKAPFAPRSKQLHHHGRAAGASSSSSSGGGSPGPEQHAKFRKHSEGTTQRSCASHGTDTGIATSSACSSSVQSQSTCSMSSSGVDTRQRGGKERKSLSPSQAKSVSLHYHELRLSSVKKEETSEESSSEPSPYHQRHFTHRQRAVPCCSSDSASTDQSERKRRRFNRTFVLLRHCGLLELTMQTASLMQQSSLMNQQLRSLRQQTEVLYNTIYGLSTSQQPLSSFDRDAAQEIMKSLRGILHHQGGHPHPLNGTPVANHQHMRRMSVKRTSCGETISPDSCNAQSSSALQNSGSSA